MERHIWIYWRRIYTVTLFWQVQVCVHIIDGTEPKVAGEAKTFEFALGIVLCDTLDIIWPFGAEL